MIKLISKSVKQYYVKNKSQVELITNMKETSPPIHFRRIDLEETEEYSQLINGKIESTVMVYEYPF